MELCKSYLPISFFLAFILSLSLYIICRQVVHNNIIDSKHSLVIEAPLPKSELIRIYYALNFFCQTIALNQVQPLIIILYYFYLLIYKELCNSHIFLIMTSSINKLFTYMAFEAMSNLLIDLGPPTPKLRKWEIHRLIWVTRQVLCIHTDSLALSVWMVLVTHHNKPFCRRILL